MSDLKNPGSVFRGIPIDLKRLVPIALCQVVGVACGVAGVRITSHLVSPSDFGVYGIFLSCAPLGMWVVHAGLLKFVARHWANSPDRNGLRQELFADGFRKLPWLAIASLVASIALLPSHWMIAAPLLFIAATLLSFTAFAEISLQALQRHWADFTVSATGSLTRTFVPPLCYVAAAHSAFALFFGYMVHTLSMALAGALFTIRRAESSERVQPQSKQLESVYKGGMFVALAVASWLLTAVNRWIASVFFGMEVAGFFTLATNLSIIVTSMLGTILLQYTQPGLFRVPSGTLQEVRHLARRIDLITAFYALVSVVGLAVLQLLAPLLIGPLIAETYRASLQFVVAAGCFGIATNIAQFYQVMLLSAKRERACWPVDLSNVATLIVGAIIAASLGQRAFVLWLSLSPLVPLLLSRAIARRQLFAGRR